MSLHVRRRAAAAGVRRKRAERGASAVEFALVMIPLLYIVFGIISFGLMLNFRQGISQAASEGARAAAVQIDSTQRSPAATAAVSSALAGMKIDGQVLACGQAHVTCSVGEPTACADQASAQCVTVTVTYPYRGYPVVPSLPVIDQLLPQTLTYSATVRVS